MVHVLQLFLRPIYYDAIIYYHSLQPWFVSALLLEWDTGNALDGCWLLQLSLALHNINIKQQQLSTADYLSKIVKYKNKMWLMMKQYKSLSLSLIIAAFALKKTYSLPRYNLPLLYQPHHPSPIHHFNFVANGHPYKITVNNQV